MRDDPFNKILLGSLTSYVPTSPGKAMPVFYGSSARRL